MNKQQRYWAKRFYSKFVIEFDTIFNINVLKMFFFVSIGITNINIIFSIVFFFVLIESEIVTIVFLIFLNEEVWIEKTIFSCVSVID